MIYRGPAEGKEFKMNRNELVRRTASYMRQNNVRKPVKAYRKVFHISDDEGNQKDFVVRENKKTVLYTIDDIEVVLDSFIDVIKEALKDGENITIHGFGTLGLHYRKPRATKKVGTDEWVSVDGRYVPKFNFGNELRMCAKLYELSPEEAAYRIEHDIGLSEDELTDEDGDL